MIGEPTGTSQKFCQQMRIALGQYFLTEHQLALPEDSITLIPLEGEGKVEERIDKLYHQLLKNTAWLEAISSADVILWGTHSQGTPVSVMLLHQLLEQGHISTQHTSICMLAMAGIGHGPFAVLQGSLIVKVNWIYRYSHDSYLMTMSSMWKRMLHVSYSSLWIQTAAFHNAFESH